MNTSNGNVPVYNDISAGGTATISGNATVSGTATITGEIRRTSTGSANMLPMPMGQ